MSKLRYADVYADVLEKFEPAESVFFVGSGISDEEPSKLPMGDELRNLYLAPLGEIHPTLKPFIASITAQKAIPRLEVALEKIIKVAGIKLLSTLALLNEAKPNGNHTILARLLREKKLTLVLTTNFDNLIEQVDRSLLAYYGDKPSTMRQMEGGILKLHGDAQDTNSIVATIERIGKESLNERKLKVLKEVFETKRVYVYGYSGMDEDIVEPIRKFTWRGLFWCGKEENLDSEVKQMLETHENGHFVPLKDYTLLKDIGEKLGLQVPKPKEGSCLTWSQNKMERSVSEYLSSLDEKEAQYVIGSLLPQIEKKGEKGQGVKDAHRILSRAVRTDPDDKSELMGRIHLELGKVAWTMKRSKESVQHCQQARRCRLKKPERVDAASTEAYALIYKGRASDAVKLLQRISNRIPNQRLAHARIKSALGDAYLELDQLKMARHFYEQARKICHKAGVLDLFCECCNDLGIVCTDMGDLKKAKGYYETAQRYSQRLGDRQVESCALANLGELDWYSGDNKSAAKKLKECIELENEYMPNWIENATTCEIYARILIDLRKRSAAEREVDRGLKLVGNERPSQRVCLLGVMVRICSQEKRWADGQKRIEEGIQLLRKHTESKYDVQWFFLYSAEFYLKQGNLDKAQEMLNKAAGIMAERKSYVKAFYFYLLSLLSKKRGALACVSCRNVIKACGIKPPWLSKLPSS